MNVILCDNYTLLSVNCSGILSKNYLCENLYFMIQRIQSIYLALAAMCGGVSFLPQVNFASSNAKNVIWSDNLLDVYDNQWTPILLGLVILITVLDIFLFNKRKSQVLALFFARILLLAFMSVLVYMLSQQTKAGIDFNYAFGFAFPALCFLFQALARNAIMKDIKLVESADRLR